MSVQKRIHDEPGWLLHHRPFRDTSQILDILTRAHGRLSLVARGSRGAKSKLRGVLRPFLPLRLSWVIRSDLGTLTGAEMNGAPISLMGDGLLSGYYVNELILKLLHRHDPQPQIYRAYSKTIADLAGRPDVSIQLRHFEMALLRDLGYALNLDHDSAHNEPLKHDSLYEYRIEQGPVPVAESVGPLTFSGAELEAIRREEFSSAAVLDNAARLLRRVIAFHLEGKELKSRKVLIEMRRSGAAKQ